LKTSCNYLSSYIFLWRVPLMKRIIFVGIWFFLFSTVVQAKTMYVSDQVEITLRTGQGTDHKIIAMIKSGDAVEVLTPGNNWTQVRTSNGKRGWVLSRFLKSEMPSRIALERLGKKHEALLAQVEPSLNEITALKSENVKLRSELALIEEALNEKNRSFEILKTESAEFFKLKSEFKTYMVVFMRCGRTFIGFHDWFQCKTPTPKTILAIEPTGGFWGIWVNCFITLSLEYE